MAAAWPITADDLRSALGYAATQGDTAELDLFAAAACERIEDAIGPWDGRSLTKTFHGPADVLLLPWRPASVESITVGGTVVDLATVTLDLDAGIIGGRFGRSAVIVSAFARANPPAIIHMAGRETAKLWWQQSKNGPRGNPANPGDQIAGPPMGADLPRKVEGWIAPYVMPGIG